MSFPLTVLVSSNDASNDRLALESIAREKEALLINIDEPASGTERLFIRAIYAGVVGTEAPARNVSDLWNSVSANMTRGSRGIMLRLRYRPAKRRLPTWFVPCVKDMINQGWTITVCVPRKFAEELRANNRVGAYIAPDQKLYTPAQQLLIPYAKAYGDALRAMHAGVSLEQYRTWRDAFVAEVRRLAGPNADALVESHILSTSGVFEAGFEAWHPDFTDPVGSARRFVPLFDFS